MWLQPKQLEMAAAARMCDSPDKPSAVGVGGARGGGKSQWMFAQIALDDCQRYAGLKVLYLRKSATAAREQIRDLLVKTCPKGVVEFNYKEQAGIIEFPKNGSFIIIKHFKDEKDIENFLGQEYDVIAIEELTTLTFDKWKNLMTCLRTSKQGWRPRFYGAWNWGGIGHAWVMKVFYTPWEERRQTDTFYIKATVNDNQHVNAENKKILESMTGWKYKSWFLGDPHFQAGQFFSNWNEDAHTYPNDNVNPDESKFIRWDASLDYGFAHPTCIHLHGTDKQGNKFTVDEEHRKETLIPEHAENLKAMLRRHHLDLSDLTSIVAGKDCFSRKQDGRTIAMDYEDCGVFLTPAEIDRVNAWAVMQQRLGDIEKGIKPTWFIHKRCTHLIAQIPMAQHHETRIGDIQKMNADEDGDGGDDALEAARNFIATDATGGAIKFAMPVALSRTPYQALGF